MVIKESGDNSDLNTLIWGSPEVSFAILFTTVIPWIVVAAGALIAVFIKDLLIVAALTDGIAYTTFFGLACAIFGFIGYNDWDREYGWRIWRRIVGYNLIVLIACAWINTIFVQKISEPVKAITFHHKTVGDCKLFVKLQSENMILDGCVKDQYRTDALKTDGNRVLLHGESSLGKKSPTSYEIVEKTIELNN